MDSTAKPKLWIVSELFYPDQTSTAYILSKIANKLVAKYDISVITNSSLYHENSNSNKPSFSISNDIKTLNVASKKRDKNDLLQRTKNVVSLSLKLSKLLWKNVRKGEKVLIVTNPAPLLILISLIRKIKKIQLYILVHDVFPENTIPSGIIKSSHSVFYKIIASIFNYAYSSADCLIVLGRDMKDIIEKKIRYTKNKPTIKVIENWADVEQITPSAIKPNLLTERHSKNIITIQYAGNIGRLQGLESFIEWLDKSSNKNLYFDLWGTGALRDKLIDKVDSLGLKNRVKFYGSYSREDQVRVLNSTDIALVSLSKGMYGLGVPSKTYNILAAGIPILFIGDMNSEIALLIQEENLGYCFSPENTNGIIAFLDNLGVNLLNKLQETGKRARTITEEKYSEHTILSKYLEVL